MGGGGFEGEVAAFDEKVWVKVKKNKFKHFDLTEFKSIKVTALKAIVSDDYLMDKLVLKGGNAIELFWNVTNRTSFDLDFSISGDLEIDIDELQRRLYKNLSAEFIKDGYVVFDLVASFKPPHLDEDDVFYFWGGYKIEFKLCLSEGMEKLKNQHDLQELRRSAMVMSPEQGRKFSIEISRREYTESRQRKDLGGYAIYVYTPIMIIFEKLRAICQQMPEYREITKKHQAERARDFFDIFKLQEHFAIDYTSDENLNILEHIFRAKKVPLSLLDQIQSSRTVHEQGYASLRDTVPSGEEIFGFDFYFDYVADMVSELIEVIRIKNIPLKGE